MQSDVSACLGEVQPKRNRTTWHLPRKLVLPMPSQMRIRSVKDWVFRPNSQWHHFVSWSKESRQTSQLAPNLIYGERSTKHTGSFRISATIHSPLCRHRPPPHSSDQEEHPIHLDPRVLHSTWHPNHRHHQRTHTGTAQLEQTILSTSRRFSIRHRCHSVPEGWQGKTPSSRIFVKNI